MNRPYLLKDPFSFGLSISLTWHVLLYFCLVPVLNVPKYVAIKNQSVFLGSILKDSDLIPRQSQPKGKKLLLRPLDYSRMIFADEFPVSLDNKPRVHLPTDVFRQEAKGAGVIQANLFETVQEISFGFSDFSSFVSHVDFSDLKKMASREELSGSIDFKVLFNGAGEVKSIKKVAGCGDPILDLYVLIKLKNALFKLYLVRPGVWQDVKFKIK
jgi:hypothetical protein